MASNIVYLTEAGLQKLKDELDHLRSVERPAISAAIAEARDKGDLSENAEYDAAKEAQGMLEMRIAKLEDTVANARVIDESRIDTNTVQILNRVKMKNMTTGKIVEYTLVSENEANLKEGKLGDRHPDRAGAARKEKGRRGGRKGSLGHASPRNPGYLDLTKTGGIPEKAAPMTPISMATGRVSAGRACSGISETDER